MGGSGKGKGGGSAFQIKHPESTVWLGSLPEGTTEDALKEHMGQCGTVKRVEVWKGGLGFAWYSSAEEATNAIAQLNGSVLNGESIVVDVWTKRDKSDKEGGAGKKVWKPQFQKNMWGGAWGGGGGGMWGPGPMMWGKGCGGMWGGPMMWGKGCGKGGKSGGKSGGKGFTVKADNADSTVWVGSLAEDTTFKQLQEHMNQAGKCKRAQVLKKGTGFCWMSSPEEASNAILMLNGSVLQGATIVVDAWTKKEKPEN